MKNGKGLLAIGLVGFASGVAAQVATYDAATGLLTLPSVKVGAETYTGGTLQNQGEFVLELKTFNLQSPPGPGLATLDGATGRVTIPAVKVGADTYTSVLLNYVGNLKFQLAGATPVTATTQAQVAAAFTAVDAIFATSTPASGAARYAHLDNCYLGDGRTKAYLVSEYDGKLADLRARDAYRVGQTSGNIEIVGERNLTNSDGSARREIDVQYDITYTDGTKAAGETATLISGSSAGSPGCANPQNSPDLRFYGNRQLVGTTIRPRIERDERYSIATGAPLNPLVTYRREVQFVVTDPLANATYVIMTGPGPSATVNGVAVQFGFKLISPQLLRSAPELAGKNQNYLNWADDDNFLPCRTTGSGVPVPSVADCVGLGALGRPAWGFGHTGTPNAAADTGFQDQGWVAGGWYRFDVYNDDGWKTINGHAGKTPIATYYQKLERLPYTFVEMAGTGVNADKFPRISFVGMTPQQVQANALSATPAPMNIAWTALAAFSDGRKFGMFQMFEYFEGPKTGNAQGVFYPAYQSLDFAYPGSTATSISGFTFHPKLSGMASKTYSNVTVEYRDRNDTAIRSRFAFQ